MGGRWKSPALWIHIQRLGPLVSYSPMRLQTYRDIRVPVFVHRLIHFGHLLVGRGLIGRFANLVTLWGWRRSL